MTKFSDKMLCFLDKLVHPEFSGSLAIPENVHESHH